MMITLFVVSPTVFADSYETESNNTYSTADITGDDVNSYGTISSSSDVDWWVIAFSQAGFANFFLGNMNNSCDYDLYLYENDGTTLIAKSVREGNRNEYIRARVQANTLYRLKIESVIGYSNDYYLLRAKRYDLLSAKYFTCDTEYDDETNQFFAETYSREGAANVLPYLWEMGYDAGEYLNNAAQHGYSVLPSTTITVFNNHAGPGKFRFITSSNAITYLYANSSSSMGSNDRAISNYSANGLANSYLIIFLGCKSALSDSGGGNLITASTEKSARCAIGWTVNINKGRSNDWAELFFKTSRNGQSVETVLNSVRTTLERKILTNYSDVLSYEYSGYAESLAI